MDDLISRQAAKDALEREKTYSAVYKYGYTQADYFKQYNMGLTDGIKALNKLSSAQPEDYTELKREFLRMASYIDVLLECSDEQKETLIGFISRLAEFMPWTERD